MCRECLLAAAYLIVGHGTCYLCGKLEFIRARNYGVNVDNGKAHTHAHAESTLVSRSGKLKLRCDLVGAMWSSLQGMSKYLRCQRYLLMPDTRTDRETGVWPESMFPMENTSSIRPLEPVGTQPSLFAPFGQPFR